MVCELASLPQIDSLGATHVSLVVPPPGGEFSIGRFRFSTFARFSARRDAML